METSDLTGFSPLTSASPKLHSWVATEKTKLRIRNGSAGFLLMHMALFFDRKVEDIDYNYRRGDLDDWGYAFRPVRGYADLSRHAYGLAIDLNATEHPLAVDHTFTPAETALIRRRLRRYDGCIRWGGDYSGRVDPMHFEIDRPLAECERVAKLLMKTPVGKFLLEKNPGQKRVIES